MLQYWHLRFLDWIAICSALLMYHRVWGRHCVFYKSHGLSSRNDNDLTRPFRCEFEGCCFSAEHSAVLQFQRRQLVQCIILRVSCHAMCVAGAMWGCVGWCVWSLRLGAYVFVVGVTQQYLRIILMRTSCCLFACSVLCFNLSLPRCYNTVQHLTAAISRMLTWHKLT